MNFTYVWCRVVLINVMCIASIVFQSMHNYSLSLSLRIQKFDHCTKLCSDSIRLKCTEVSKSLSARRLNNKWLNVNKCKVIHIVYSDHQAEYFLEGNTLDENASRKDLGVVIANNSLSNLGVVITNNSLISRSCVLLWRRKCKQRKSQST